MTSQLNVDTIVDKAGSGGTNVKIGNTSTYVSDGGAVTQNTVQGLAKVWSCVEQGTTAFDDSFNCSGITDEATGRFTPAFSNNMNNALYSLTGCCDANGVVALYGGSEKISSSVQIQTGDGLGSGGLLDYDNAMSTVHGDLA